MRVCVCVCPFVVETLPFKYMNKSWISNAAVLGDGAYWEMTNPGEAEDRTHILGLWDLHQCHPGALRPLALDWGFHHCSALFLRLQTCTECGAFSGSVTYSLQGTFQPSQSSESFPPTSAQLYLSTYLSVCLSTFLSIHPSTSYSFYLFGESQLIQ